MSEARGTHDHSLLSQIRDSPNLEGQVPLFISPRNKVARLYPQALGSLFVASYDSQSYGGGIRPCLHTGVGSRSMPKLCYDGRSVGQSALVPSTHLGLKTRFFPSYNCRFVDMGHPLRREDGSVFYNAQCTIFLHFTCYYMNIYTQYIQVHSQYSRSCPILSREGVDSNLFLLV
jgi:hypothetical protein